MENWYKFEIECTQYLNSKFGNLAHFSHMGGGDSTTADICVKTNTGKIFFMDVKSTPAQCGQFVLVPDIHTKKFTFSNQNKTILTPTVQAIIDHMNHNFDSYNHAGTAGQIIDLGDEGKTFAQWIVSTYQNKGVQFFITNHYVIVPSKDFSEHFTVSATYRVKRSGSTAVGIRNFSDVTNYINHHFLIENIRTANNKLFVSSSAQLHNQRFYLNEFEYMFSARGDEYEIRKLSNTFHANVIFSIEKKDKKGLSDREFEELLV